MDVHTLKLTLLLVVSLAGTCLTIATGYSLNVLNSQVVLLEPLALTLCSLKSFHTPDGQIFFMYCDLHNTEAIVLLALCDNTHKVIL